MIPKGLAEPATETNLKALNQRLAAKAAHETKERAGYQALAEKLQATLLRFMLKMGEKDQVFGSITAQDIADELAQNGIKIEKSWIELEQGIKTTGEHQVKVKLPHQIIAEIKITVEAKKLV